MADRTIAAVSSGLAARMILNPETSLGQTAAARDVSVSPFCSLYAPPSIFWPEKSGLTASDAPDRLVGLILVASLT